jgi:hypothetical protein
LRFRVSMRILLSTNKRGLSMSVPFVPQGADYRRSVLGRVVPPCAVNALQGAAELRIFALALCRRRKLDNHPCPPRRNIGGNVNRQPVAGGYFDSLFDSHGSTIPQAGPFHKPSGKGR